MELCLATMAVVSPEGAIAVLGAHDAIAKARGVIMPGYYDCITCGPLDMEYHDARDAGNAVCMLACIANGVCDNVARPAKKADGDCYWYGLNGHMRRMVSARPGAPRTQRGRTAAIHPATGGANGV